ncbi:hypothetical protein BDQ17DRAFT_1431588 [Cyathus striatus]|nr:hypothetical protein BDQ17DRAFT_1431588 [Cyathus striatus]
MHHRWNYKYLSLPNFPFIESIFFERYNASISISSPHVSPQDHNHIGSHKHHAYSTSASESNDGLVAVVTGASGGIGRSIALRLAQDGYHISINDLPSNNEKLKEVERDIVGMGKKCFISLGDVSKEEVVKSLVQNAADELGGIDVMVANAGIFSGKNSILDSKHSFSISYQHDLTARLIAATVDQMDRSYSVNIRGVFLCYKYAANQMIKQGRGGRIIGASSLAGKQGYPFVSPYVTSKFAVRGLTQSAASELGKYGITVNAYAPGFVETAMMKQFRDPSPGSSQFSTVNPVGRVGDVRDIASLVSFLASSGSGFITGQSISINGGVFFD